MSLGETHGHLMTLCRHCELVFAQALDCSNANAHQYQGYAKSDQYEKKAASKIRRAKSRIRRLAGWERPETFLEIGCNLGFATHAASSLGLQATGIDIDRQAIAAASSRFPDCEFVAGSTSTLVADRRRFDLLYASEVIEHVEDPRAFTLDAARLLRFPGRLYLTTPDIGDDPENLLTRHRELVKPPEHLLYFNRRSIRHLLSSYGFTDIRFTRTRKAQLKLRCRLSS